MARNQVNSALELILALLPSLTEKETGELKRKLLEIKEPTPCDKTGHKYVVETNEKEWYEFWKPTKSLTCVRCGTVVYK